ncbi:hypothetical protein DQ04_02691040 [Trypanosoma grayi]|uniref:hypothetical protein n=1 Tax=Trypanosoma grayi TaxID=71804 RepID=UPI0004F46D04|nr:hypothetical protein DQ04_02691040 [Trypanosoma grayi]KEG11371.1 hypothetical protein DQ04_02691040 [Trypanosoma grayi]
MPPKLPNLKYKPRRVVRPKDENDESHSSTGVEDLSLVQLERLRLQQEAALQQETLSNSATASLPRNIHPAAAPPTDGMPVRKPNRVQSAPAAANRAAAYLPAEAERFPANTMWKILEMVEENPNMTVYHPTPLDSALPARLRASDGEGPVEGDDQRPETTGEEEGIMFLKEYDEELRRSRQANLRFEREILHASANKIDVETVVGRHGEGELVWLQLPRFHADPPFALAQLPAGKVGEVKVYRSGRMVMEICGVHYDVAVEGYTAGDDDACNIVTAVAPSQQPDEKASCYQLGLLAKKMVCTPDITVDK